MLVAKVVQTSAFSSLFCSGTYMAEVVVQKKRGLFCLFCSDVYMARASSSRKADSLSLSPVFFEGFEEGSPFPFRVTRRFLSPCLLGSLQVYCGYLATRGLRLEAATNAFRSWETLTSTRQLRNVSLFADKFRCMCPRVGVAGPRAPPLPLCLVFPRNENSAKAVVIVVRFYAIIGLLVVVTPPISPVIGRRIIACVPILHRFYRPCVLRLPTTTIPPNTHVSLSFPVIGYDTRAYFHCRVIGLVFFVFPQPSPLPLL